MELYGSTEHSLGNAEFKYESFFELDIFMQTEVTCLWGLPG